MLARSLSILVALLLTPMATWIPSAAAQEPDWKFTDPAGDADVTALVFPLGKPGQPTPIADRIDIVAVGLTESPDQLSFEIVVNSLRSSATYPSDMAKLIIRFKVPGSEPEFQLDANAFTPLAGFGSNVGAQFCIFSTAFKRGCTGVDSVLVVDEPQNTYRIAFAKSLLSGYDASGKFFAEGVGELPKLNPGSPLGPWTITMQRPVAVFAAQVEDSAVSPGGEAGFYRLKYGIANQEILLAVPGLLPPKYGFYGSASYAPPFLGTAVGTPIGQTLQLPVQLENRGDTKRLVNLTAEFMDSEAPRHWTIGFPPSVEVPAGQRRNATLTITTAEGAAHRDRGVLALRATALATNAIGAVLITLVVASPVDPAHAKLSMHAASTNGATLCPNCYQREYWMSTAASDPLATGDQAVPPGSGTWFPMSDIANFDIWLDTPVPGTTVFGEGGSITGALSFSARSDMLVATHISLVVVPNAQCSGWNFGCSDIEQVGAATVEHTIGTAPKAVEFSMLVPEELRFSKGTMRLTVVMKHRDQASDLASGSLLYHPKDSFLNLPLVPDTLKANVSSHLRFYLTGDREPFLNPGRTLAANVRIANEGTEPDRILVNASIAPAGWTVSLRPGERFDLQPGESVNLGVLIRAPDDAAEGALANITLTAASEGLSTAPGQLSFRAIATRGIDIPDQADGFVADDETRLRAVQETGEKSPSVDLLAVLVALGLVLGLVRRRR